jgi:N6-adenosine-specific RNA methylase IME4/ParB-like chromosome segregation protein Spo0J
MSSTPAPDTGPVKRDVAELREHPQAASVPPAQADTQAALRADVAANGVQVPLEITSAGVVLDGRARLQIARELALGHLEVVVVAPDDEVEHMLRRALHRRQLTASQKAAIAVKLADHQQLRAQARSRQDANLRRGDAAPEEATLPAREGRTSEQLARIAGASPRTVQDVITVSDHDPALLERVLNGEISASTAARKVRRARRDAAIPQPPPMPEGPFPLILADPPWQTGSPDSEFAPEQHYPTMPLAEIKALHLPAADDCVLFLWVVNSLLPEGFEVLKAWGFDYRANLAWIKNGIGPGVWLRQRHELLLVGIKGQISPPDPEDRCDSVIDSRRRKHSQKPDQAYERIEQMYPHLPKLELFARGAPRPGWQTWGNQAEPTSQPEHEPSPAEAEPAETDPAKPESGSR